MEKFIIDNRTRFTEIDTGAVDSFGQKIFIGDVVVLGQDSTAYTGGNVLFVAQRGNDTCGFKQQVKITKANGYASETFVIAKNYTVINETALNVFPDLAEQFDSVKRVFVAEKPKQPLKTAYRVLSYRKNADFPYTYYALRAHGHTAPEIQQEFNRMILQIMRKHAIDYVMSIRVVYVAKDGSLREAYSHDDLTKKEFLQIVGEMPDFGEDGIASVNPIKEVISSGY